MRLTGAGAPVIGISFRVSFEEKSHVCEETPEWRSRSDYTCPDSFSAERDFSWVSHMNTKKNNHQANRALRRRTEEVRRR